MLALHDLRWYGKGETVTVGEYLLRDPMVYVCRGTRAYDEASCIDPTFELGQPLAENVVGLRKNPSYDLLSPNQRAYYLRWMANGRVGRLENIGFAFLFFNGLERRCLVEQEDQRPILEEVVRLLDSYPSFGLFDAQLNLFLAFALARLGIDSIDDSLFSEVFEKSRLKWDEDSLPLLKWDESLLAVAFAWFYERRLSLPASWAMRAARKDPHFPASVAATVQPERLKSLFELRYQEEFGRGLILEAFRDDREMHYRPVSPSLLRAANSSKSRNWSIKVPDVLDFKSQFEPLAKLLSRCVDELIATSRASAPISREDPDRRSRQMRWRGQGDSFDVGAFRLVDPMVYASERKPSEEEASCIDLSQRVGKPVWEMPGRLGYSPTYARLTPDQRANYLRWLSNGRIDPLNEIGYATLFFYGLERRLIAERKDLSPIVKETIRLLETYTFSVSFDDKLSRFLAYALARAGFETINDDWIGLALEKLRLRIDDDLLAVVLAWFFKKNAPLPAAWAMRIARQGPRSPANVVLDSVSEEVRMLFEERYRRRFGDGLTPKAAKSERLVTYRPVSPSPCFDVELSDLATKPITIPNVLGLQSQFAPLTTIWSRCVELLRPTSQLLAKGMEVDSREAFEVLPDRLKAKVTHPDQGKWGTLVSTHTGEGGCALVEISKLAAIHGVEQRAKLTPGQSQSLARTAQYMGLLIEPDARLTLRPYGWDDVVSLLRHEGGPCFPAESRYLEASLMLELGIFVAAAGGSVNDAEVVQVARFVEAQFPLNPLDARRLEALKRVFMARPPTLADLGKKLHTAFSREQRDAVGQSLIGIAAANGIIDRKKVSALGTAFRALDIGRDQLKIVVEQVRRSSQDPIEVERGERFAERGEPIPARTRAGQPEGFALDDEVLRRLMAETEKVAVILGEAMREESLAGEPEQQVVLPVLDVRFEALDPRFRAMLSQLLSRPMWRRAEFESLARACSLMPEGAIDAVNTWAYELFDDPIIIEQGEELAVQVYLVETLS